MRFFNALTEWKEARYQKKLADMQAQNKCPDCRGNGYSPLMVHEFSYTNLYDCHGCNGSGLFADWARANPHL
ncbi:hypothetical protein DFP93_10931 [Aneurinibacillus soli]|uniref:Uncharacterized protein n=1 Tax=Aneurinibacillus soli TaxID=1500254 RepID=A0A0U5B3D6_9BACL|nr:methionine aminopeptidase [Aneurinibacillus soli]PYE61332.1 hypothetical protein DFP93_10931 [Aneurinibacillus soli]BAU27839.1 hypothetical protein CB4_02013 [Aneurinibacillus soli]